MVRGERGRGGGEEGCLDWVGAQKKIGAFACIFARCGVFPSLCRLARQGRVVKRGQVSSALRAHVRRLLHLRDVPHGLASRVEPLHVRPPSSNLHA